EFNTKRRQTQAAVERQFIEARLAEVRDEVATAEERLARFLRTNRLFQTSPELGFEHDRLDREVMLRQQLYTSLVQAYEQARIDEVRNTPVIVVVEQPRRPVKPESRGLLVKALVSLILTFLLAIGAAFGIEFGRLARSQDPEGFLRFADARAHAVSDVRGVLRSAGGFLHRGSTQK